MKQRFRLRRRQDFDRVMRARRVFAGQAIVAFASPSPDGRWRVGVTVSRRLKGAVNRNRVRRRLREAAMAGLLPSASGSAGNRPGEAPTASGAAAHGSGYDVVLIGRPAALGLPLEALSEEAGRVRSRLLEQDA